MKDGDLETHGRLESEVLVKAVSSAGSGKG